MHRCLGRTVGGTGTGHAGDAAFERRVITLADGRDLAWVEFGSAAGSPVLALHGSPGSGSDFTPYHHAALDQDVRLIAMDRPGYGHSTYLPRRTLGHFASDVRELADHLDLERFGVIGHSGGGPHALASARYLPDRVAACGILSGLAPQTEPPRNDGMVLSNRVQTTLYRNWPKQLDALALALGLLTVPFIAPLLRRARRRPEREIDRVMPRMLPPCDLAVVARPEIRAVLLREAAILSIGMLRASIQDMAVGIRDWDFELRDIDVPVHVWHGDLDRNIPLSHGRRQADAIPGAVLHLCPGEGHWLLVDHMSEVLDAVAAYSLGPARRFAPASAESGLRPGGRDAG